MKSETHVSKGCLTLRIALLLSSLLFIDCSKSLSLIASQSRPSRPLLSGQTQTQFVYQTLPLNDRQSLPSLGPTLPIAEALSSASNGTNGCSPLDKYPICWCYDSDQGLLIDCGIEEITEMSYVLSALSRPIKSLSFHSINESLDSLVSLPDHLFHNLSTLASLEQISLSLPSLAQLSLEAFLGLESSLKSLSLINTNLRAVPKPALSRLKSLTTLDLQSNAINQVEPYAFYGLPLVTLNLQSNLIDALQEMSLAGLERSLVELVLIDNRLHSFPFSALTRLSSLEILRLQSNRISVLSHDSTTPLSILPVLKTLDLHSNRITVLDGQALLFSPNLVSLSVANNSVTAINNSLLQSLSHLESLDLSYNQLEAVVLKDLVTLKTVDLSNNRLEDIGFDNLSKLKEVFGSHNRIVRLTDQMFVNSSSLSAVFLQNNAIESIDYNALHSLPNLITLDLSSNKLKTIDPRLLAHSTQLQSLYLDHNMLNDSGLESNTFAQLPLLQQIDLSHNVFRSIPSLLFNGTPSLESLQLDSNSLSSLPNTLIAGSLSKLKILTLNKNPIVKIKEDKSHSYGLESLESLYINDANLSIITSYDLIGFPNLKTLSLRNNRIENVLPSALRPVPLLCELDLSTNKIDIFPEERFTGLLWLQTLNLSQNNLLELPQFSPDLQSLQTLDLSFNRLTRIHTFGHLGDSVAHISVRHNMIGWIAINAFHNLTALKSLDLRHNLLTQVSQTLLEAIEQSLQSILLSGNPFYCDCRLLPIYKWLESRWSALSDRQELTCAQPEKLLRKSIVSLHPTDFCPVPIISMMEISKLESTQVRIRWQVHNVSLLGGFTLEYYLTANQTPPLTQKILGPFDRQLDIVDLKPDNWYTVCIQANGKYVRTDDSKPAINTIDHMNHMKSFAEFFSTTRKCSQVRTLSLNERTLVSLSTWALILGLVVIVVLALTLCVICADYRLKVRRRSPLKSQVSEEYITYRHFSLPSSENVYS